MSSDFLNQTLLRWVLAKEETLSQLASAKYVLTELKVVVDKTSLDDLD